MKARELIENSISRTEKKYFPHIYSDIKDAHEIYSLFKSYISDYYTKLLEDKSIKKIRKDDNLKSENLFILDDFFLHINTKKYNVINYILDISNTFYKNRSAKNSELDIIINIIVSYGVDFIKEISKEILNNNKKEIQLSDTEALLLIQKSDFSFTQPVLPISKIKNIKRFQEITGQKTLFSLGQGSDSNINSWVDKFCQHAPKAMEAIGLNEKAISINRNIDFFYNNNNSLISENAFIHYDFNDKISDRRLYITFNHNKDDNRTPLLILHEWTHGVDILLEREHKTNVNFMSSNFISVDKIINKNHPLKKTIELGESLFSSILNETDKKTYLMEKEVAVNKYKDFIKNLIGENISDKPEYWHNLSDDKKNIIYNLPSFKKLINLPIASIRNQDENAIKIIGKTLHNIISSNSYKEIFPNTNHLDITNHSKIILYKTREYSLKNNISWFKVKERKGYYENFALTNTDFAKFSSVKGMITKREYLFYPHEMFARTIQMLATPSMSYEKSTAQKLQKTLDERMHLLKISILPELSYQTKSIALELIQEMVKNLKIHPEKDFKEIIKENSIDYISADIGNKSRGKLSENNAMIKKLQRINKNEIEVCEELINIKSNRIKLH